MSKSDKHHLKHHQFVTQKTFKIFPSSYVECGVIPVYHFGIPKKLHCKPPPSDLAYLSNIKSKL